MRIVMLILIPPIFLFVFALVAMRVPLPQPFPPPDSTARTRLAAVATGVLGAVYLIGVAGYVIFSLLQAGRAPDPVFTSRGLAPQDYSIAGRQYHGLVQGRQVDAYFTPSYALNPARLEIHVAAAIDVRAAVGEQRPLLDCTDCPRVDVGEPDLDHLQILTQEAAWARSLLSAPENKVALIRLMDGQETLGFREIYFQPGQPGKVWLSSHPSAQVTEDQIQQWLDDLLALAEAAETSAP